MTHTRRCLFLRDRNRPAGVLALTIAVMMLAALFPSPSEGYVWKDESRGTNLSIHGLGTLRLNYATVDGNVAAFEASDTNFGEHFATDGMLSLMVNGTLWHHYELEGYAKYNEENDNNLPDWNLRFQMSRDASYLIAGDQSTIFQDTYFTRYSDPFRGLTLHLESDTLGATAFGALTRGTLKKEDIAPNGTSGPYLLEDFPVVHGSEKVTLEVRNRNDPDNVLDTIVQERDEDYTIDYQEGEIRFTHPVDPETFQGNPVVIVVIYRSEKESSAFNTALMGGRTAVTPTGWATFGATYLSEFSREPSLSEGFDIRQDVYGLDSTFTLGNALTLTTEYAASRDYALSDSLRHAFRAALEGNVSQNVELRGRYQRAERDFLTFGNPEITPDQQAFDVGATYTYRPNHLLKTGYSFLQDNLPHDPDSPTTTTHRPSIGWEAYVRDHTKLFTTYEFIRTSDDQNPKATNTFTHVALVGGEQEFREVPLLNRLIVTGEYQWTDFEDDADVQADTITHQTGLRLRSEPVEKIGVYIEQRERWLHEKGLGQNTERQDISEVGLELNRWERFSAQARYRYNVGHDLLADQRSSRIHTATLSSTFQPWTRLTGTAKLELRDERAFDVAATGEGAQAEAKSLSPAEERSSQSVLVEGRLRLALADGLTARLRYAYDYTEEQADTLVESRENEFEFQINYVFDSQKAQLTGGVKIEPDLLKAPPAPATETQTVTYLLSGSRQLSEHWSMLAQYKWEIENGDAENACEDMLAEVGYQIGRYLKFAGGYQYETFADDQESESNYDAHSVYVKLIGKL